MKIVTPYQMKVLEATADNNGVSYERLMLNAGKILADTIKEHSSPNDKILFLCGNGNNSGDCFVASKILAENHDFKIDIAMLCGEPKTQLSQKMFAEIPNSVNIVQNIHKVRYLYTNYNIICDGIFGTGFHGELPKQIQDIFKLPTKAYKIAVDIPSGINCLTGEVSNGTLKCDTTLTFAYRKVGMMLYPAIEYCGNITVADINITDTHYSNCIENPIEILSKENIELPKRDKKGHKGTFGRLLHITGSKDMLGACIMASKSSLRCGVGLLTICTENHDILPLSMPEPIYISRNYDDIQKELNKTSAILIGCGLDTNEKSVEIFNYVLKNTEKPIIIDADGINILSNCIDIIENKNVILTPHPMEFSRLTGLSVKDIQSNRVNLAIEFAKKHRCTLILKGSGDTVITDGKSTYICNVANSGLGKGGSGDVLSGIISSFVAQGLSPMDACKLGVYIHSQAGLICAEKFGEFSMLPTDVINEIPNVIKNLE